MKRADKPPRGGGDVSFGGMMQTFGGFLDLLSKLSAENGSSIERTGEIGEENGRVKAVYGFSVRVGGQGEPRVQPFGNVKVDASGPKVAEAREPIVDVFDESDFILIVAELPGVSTEQINFQVHGDVFELDAKHGERSYHKEILLPSAVDAARANSSHRNGVFEIKLPKAS